MHNERTPLHWIEQVLLIIAASLIMIFCLLGWLIAPLLLLTPWPDLGIVCGVLWFLWIAVCVAYEWRTRVRLRRISQANN